MKIKIMCEWCGNTIATVNTFEKVRDAQQKGQNTCRVCQKKVAKVDTYFNNARQKLDSRMDLLIKEIKNEFKAGLQKGDFDDGKNIQDLGSEDKTSRRPSK
jgi:hypothetical protein